MSAPIGVLGAGGHAKVVIAVAHACGIEVAGAFDDDQQRWGSAILGVPIRDPQDLARHCERAIIAIGNNAVRQRLSRELSLDWVSLVHPSAVVHDSVTVAPGAVVMAGVVIQPDTAVGAHAIVNTAASVDHDCQLGAFTHVGPGAHLCGGVSVGEGTLVGVGACAIPSVTIGAWSTVGAGAVVIRDVGDRVTAVGNPAS